MTEPRNTMPELTKEKLGEFKAKRKRLHWRKTVTLTMGEFGSLLDHIAALTEERDSAQAENNVLTTERIITMKHDIRTAGTNYIATRHPAHKDCCGCITVIESDTKPELIFVCNECAKEVGRAAIPEADV